MALAIKSKFLAKHIMGWLSGFLGPRYHVYRACAHATVILDRAHHKRRRSARAFDLAKREALEWQADQDEDLDEAEVIYHLHQQAKSSPLLEHAFSRTECSNAITLVTSCSSPSPSPSLFADAQGRPLSSFHRLSFRQSMFSSDIGHPYADVCNANKIFRNELQRKDMWIPVAPDIIGDNLPVYGTSVLWHLQFDIVDLRSPRTVPTWRPGKRRRTTINPFHQVTAPPEQDAAPGNHPPEAKRFKGVRYRPDRRTWAAEMKPPNCTKVSFGEFKSQAQAARAIDAAYHYYGKPHLLNFPDTPEILSTRPSPSGPLNEKDLLSFVKEQVKWLALVASTLPSSSPSVPLEIPESSSRDCIGDTLGFFTVSEIASFLSCGVVDEADDDVTQPLPSLASDAQAGLVGSASMEPPFVGREHRSMLEWSSEDGLGAPRSSGRWSPGSSVQITHGWDDAEVSGVPALMNFTSSAEPSCESPGSWMNCLAMSPPASMLPLPPWSPTSFPVDVAHGLLESESFGGGEWLRG